MAQVEHQEECHTLQWEEHQQLESTILQQDIQRSLRLNQFQVEVIQVLVEVHSLKLNRLVFPLSTQACHKTLVMVSLKVQSAIQALVNKLLNKILVTPLLEQHNQIMVIQQLVIQHSHTVNHRFLLHKPLVALPCQE